jgi:hypothetical protein
MAHMATAVHHVCNTKPCYNYDSHWSPVQGLKQLLCARNPEMPMPPMAIITACAARGVAWWCCDQMQQH